MLILGMDTSGKTAAAAVYDTEEDRILAAQTVYTKQIMLPLCQRVLGDVQLRLADLDCLAVAVGPGSYTGLRIGIAATKAMAYALQLPCAGISTLKGLAYQAQGFCGSICAVMQARQTLVYGGLYRSGADGALEAVVPDQLLEREELAALLQAQQQPVLLVGDAAAAFQTAFPELPLQLAPAPVRLQNGCGICLAARYETGITPDQLEAAYLQPVKAEKDRMQK
mgnify:CR=1 FL=1